MKTDDELIAEFIGKPLFLVRYDDVGRSDHKINYDGYFHEWNNIMIVVENIEDKGYTVEIYKNCCKIGGSGGRHSFNGSKIDAVYTEIVEFIKWYNNEKATPNP